MNKVIYCAFIVSLFILFSCNEQAKEDKHVESTNTSLLSPQLKAIDDSCSKAWNMMISSDDQKIKDIIRLLQEISYIPNHNEAEIQKLSEEAKKLSTLRYTQDNLNSDKIDAYDKATDELLKAVFELKRNTKGVEQYTLTEELETSIREADAKVINYRVLYDTWSKKYNEAVEASNSKGLDKKANFQY